MSEVIDGEVIIIDMRSGTYFSSQGLGASLWSAAAAGQSRTRLIAAMEEAFAETVTVRADVEDFLNLLVNNGLLVEEDVAATGSPIALPRCSYDAPRLERHSDMQDLIMLDPVHDVDAVGWPTRREATTPFAAA